MITFEQFSERLARGQLKNTSAVENTNLGEICPEYVPTILNLTNQGLVDLSTRFALVTKQVDLTFEEGRNIYSLTGDPMPDYLSYTDDTYVDDEFIKVLDIWDENGKRHPHDTNGHILTPTYNTLRFTQSKKDELGTKVRIRYQAKYEQLEEDGVITIPPNLVTALQLFVASLYISHMNGPEHSAKGDSYYGAYLRHLGEDESKNNSSTSEVDEDSRLQDRGFV